MAHTLTVTEKGKPRGRLVFVANLGDPLKGRTDATALDDDLEAQLEDIATVDRGSLWTSLGVRFAPLDINTWQDLDAAASELARRNRGLVLVWDSSPPARLLEPDGPPPDDADI